MSKQIFLAAFFLYNLSIGISAKQKPVRKCAFDAKGGNYKPVVIAREKIGTVDLRIFVKPKNFNAEFMRKLAQRLKAEYCNDNEIYAVIFDDWKLAESAFYIDDYIQSGGKIVQMRGFHSLDRKRGKELIEFSKNPGNPTTEVLIDLSAIQISSENDR